MGKVIYYQDQPLEPDMILETFYQSYGISLDYKYWIWRYLNNPVSENIYINYIKSHGLIASYISASPVKILMNGRSENMALLSMCMTHPEHQGKGYFTLLAIDLINKLKNEGYIGLFGFANQNSHYTFRKNLGWVDLQELSGFSVDKYSFRRKLLNNNLVINFSDSELVLDHIQEIKKLICSNQMIIPCRDEKFLSWRIIENPKFHYYNLFIRYANEIIGSIIYKFYNGSIDIMEFFYIKNNTSESDNILLRGIMFLLDKYECRVNIWSNLCSEEHLMLEKHGFRKNNFITYFGVIPLKFRNQLTNISNWHFRFLDSDVF